jgi:hypothetical protein
VNVGHLYVVHTTLTNPPKDKLVICVCDAVPLFLWINTHPRHHGIGQMPLISTDHAALAHNCHLDCSRLTSFRPAEIGGALDRGIISQALAAQIVQFVTENPPKTLIRPHLDKVVSNLGALY